MIKKSILILIQADNSEFSKKSLELIGRTWAKPVLDGKYPNITLFAYTAMSDDILCRTIHANRGIVDNASNTVYVPAPDDMYGSFKKTYLTLKTLEPYIKRCRIDYIFKTDLSTYVNIPLLDKFVQDYIQDGEEVIYTGRIKSSRYAIGPQEFCLYADKSSILFPVRPYFNVLTQAKYRNDAIRNDKVNAPEFWNNYRMNVAENAMGFIIDNYLIEYQKEMSDFYRDWNMRTFTNIDEDMWHKQMVMTVGSSCACKECELDDMQYVHDVVSDWYLDGNKPDISYIQNYLYSSRCPKIYCVDEKEDSEKWTVLSLDQWKNVYEKKSLETVIPDNNEPGSSNQGSGSSEWPSGQCFHYSYLDYFNIPHHHFDNCPYHYNDCNHSHVNEGNQSNSNSNSNTNSSSNDFDFDTSEDLNSSNGGHINKGRYCHCQDEDIVWNPDLDFPDEIPSDKCPGNCWQKPSHKHDCGCKDIWCTGEEYHDPNSAYDCKDKCACDKPECCQKPEKEEPKCDCLNNYVTVPSEETKVIVNIPSEVVSVEEVATEEPVSLEEVKAEEPKVVVAPKVKKPIKKVPRPDADRRPKVEVLKEEPVEVVSLEEVKTEEPKVETEPKEESVEKKHHIKVYSKLTGLRDKYRLMNGKPVEEPKVEEELKEEPKSAPKTPEEVSDRLSKISKLIKNLK